VTRDGDEASETKALRTRLRRALGRVHWSDLRAHSDRQALILVVGADLLEVAVATAQDDVVSVQRWMDRGQLTRPSPAQLNAWAEQETKAFESVVVQPYVLAAEV
jgi:hypothetical protein